MRVVITRPAGDATAWVSALQAAGHTALSLPLIDVGPATLTQPVADAWERWGEWDAVMFVSAQAVRYFFGQQPQGNLSHRATAGPTCWATGPGTHKALRQAGVPEASIVSPSANAVQFDSEALWQRVGANVASGHKVLIVRGNDRDEATAQDHAQTGSGRDWLAQQIQAAGASAHFVVAYERRRPHWTSTQQAMARHAAIDGSMWCFSSSQAIRHLGLTLPDTPWSQARCIATHDRIVESAQSLGFGEVHLSRPSVEDVLRSLESLT